MRFLRHLPIKQKLTIITMLASGVALLLACVAFATYEQMNFRSRMVRDLSIIADMTGANTAAGLTFTDASSVDQTLSSLQAHSHIVRACVFDNGGRLFAKYQRADVKNTFLAPFPQSDGHRFGEQHLDLFRRISLAGETIGTIYIQSDLLEIRERIGRYALIVGALLLAGSMVAFLLASRMQRIISEPIANLAATAATVATQKNYAIRAAKQYDDEIGSLIDGFNEMLAQIQERDTALQTARDDLEKRVEQRTVELSKANGELRDSAARFHTVWESAHDAMRLLDDNGVIVAVNAAFCRLFAMKREELEGAPFTVTYSGDRDSAELQERFRERFRKNDIVPQEERRMVLRNGRTVDLEIGSTLIELPGRNALLLGLFRDITERKRAAEELEQTHRQLLETSRQAGMAEVATGVLHNVGNVLNSVNVSATLVTETLKKSKVSSLAKVAALLRDQSDAARFFAEDPRGKQLPGYLGQLANHLAGEQAAALTEVDSLRKNIDHIKDIVSMQQSYAQVSGVTETVHVVDLVEDALRMNAAALLRHEIQVVRDYAEVPAVPLDKHKVLQILVNLIRNAKYACEESLGRDKRMIVRLAAGDGSVRIEIIDNGVGIPPENLTRIFAHGFTTRKHGHGFGLHSGALAAREMKGSLCVHSDGPGQGATFSLELPANLPKEIA